jgi:hypothetical protein
VSAGIAFPPNYSGNPDDDFYDGEETVFDRNFHQRPGAEPGFQTASFYRPPARAGYTGTFRPDRPFSQTFAYVLPPQDEPFQPAGEWFRPASPRSNAAEAVYAYSTDEPFNQPDQVNLLAQARQFGEELFQNRRVGLLVLVLALIVLTWASLNWLNNTGRAEGDIYQFSGSSTISHALTGTTANNTQPESKPQGNPPPVAPGAHSVIGSPTITADKIAQVLKQYNSPAVGVSQAIYDMGVKYGIDPAYALAFFIHESSAGTKGIAVTTKSLGNIRQTNNSGFEGYQGFRKYPSWEAGAEDWYKLIRNLYIDGWNLKTVEQIIPKYAPAADSNNPPVYINAVNTLVESWRNSK